MHAPSARHPLPLRLLLLAMAGFSAGNGALMMLAPLRWYGCIANPLRGGGAGSHFIADTGAAYISVGAALLWAALQPAQATALLAIALLFSTLHAAYHVYEYVTLGAPAAYPVVEAGGVWLPLLLLGAIALYRRRPSRR